MILSNVVLSALTLISTVAASPMTNFTQRAQNVIIGYRTVSPEQAQRWNNAGTPTDDGNLISTQIGKGVYTTPGRGQWPGGPTSWYCVIFADSDALNRVSKAWVPRIFNGVELWFKGDQVVDNYIRALDNSWNPAKTLRMSIIDGGGNNALQMVIPPGLLNSNGGEMGLVANCRERVEDMPTFIVNYDAWSNVKGSRA